ncbi:MAG: murein biosynthesis integral membrane protein MurJ [Planctomycetota bacterium]
MTALARAVRVVSSLTLVSRVAGLVRDVVTARLFGDTAIGSAFAAAFAVPNTFRRLFGEGALAAAFVPEYAQLVERDPRAADRFASFTLAVIAAATTLLVVLAEAALWLVVVRLDEGTQRFSLVLVMVALPFMPLICIAAVMAGVLQARGRFGPPAAQPIVLNTCVLGAAGAHALREGAPLESAAMLLCGAVVLSGAIQVAWSALALRPHVRWTRALAGVGDSARRLLGRWATAVIGLGTLQASALVDVLLAMWPIWVGGVVFGVAYPLDEQSNAVLFYAQRLYQFPLGVFGVAVATAALPLLSRAAGDAARFRSATVDALCLTLAIALPASVGLVLVSGDLVAVLFSGWGSFSAEGVGRASAALVGYASCVWAYAINQVLTRGFYALGDTRTPALVAVGVLLANLALNLSLIWVLREAGLAWATAIAAVLQAVVLAVLLRRRHGVRVAGEAWRRTSRAAVPLVAVIAAVLAVRFLWVGEDWGVRLGRLAACVLAGVAAYGVASRVVGYGELRRLLARSRG